MSDIFQVNQGDLKKLQKFFQNSPRDFRIATAGILNSLAFQTRKNDIKEITGNMIIRNRRFVESSIQVEKTRANSIESQIAYEGSVNRKDFSGWKEQEYGTDSIKHRAGTIHSRGGSKMSVMKAKARMKPSNKFYKPSQFSAKNKKSSFQFMLRVLATRGGGEFFLDENIQTKSGVLGKGLYELRQHKIKKLQRIGGLNRPRRTSWHTRALLELTHSNQIEQIWNQQLQRIINIYNK